MGSRRFPSELILEVRDPLLERVNAFLQIDELGSEGELVDLLLQRGHPLFKSANG